MLATVLDDLNIDVLKSARLREAGFELDIYVGIFYAPSSWGFTIDPEIMIKLGKMSTGFSITM